MKAKVSPKTGCFSRIYQRGYSFVELLGVIAIITILAGLGVVSVSVVTKTAYKSKLERDVLTLNSSLKIYVANGGDLTGLTTPTQILNKLKTTRSAADQKLHTGGPSGRMIDPRIIAVDVPAGGWKTRAVYSAAKQAFEISKENTSAGVAFDMDDSLNEMAIPVESRDHGVVNYARKESWVWDHGKLANPNGPNGPSDINTGIAPPNTIPGGGNGGKGPGNGSGGGGTGPEEEEEEEPPVEEEEEEPAPIPRLPYPQYSHAGGGHPDTDFPLNLTLTNVPDSAIGTPLVRIAGGAWEPYSGAISVPFNTRVKARYVAVDPKTHKNSSTNSKYFYPIASSLSGNVKGDFKDAEGGANLMSEVSQGGKFFTHGDPTIDLGGEIIDAGEPNTLKFEQTAIDDVEPGEQFKLGDLYYHNGTTFNDSHATGVTLQVQINLQNPNQTLTFDLDMDLVNTDNTDDDNASADYVKLNNLNQAVPLNINGVGYQIQLEFGGTDSFGFSTSNQFHVYEGATGQGELRATFIAKP